MTVPPFAFSVALLSACQGPAPAEAPVAGAADCPDYATVGAPTLTTWCAACHSAALAGAARYGAPEGVDFDTLEGARAWKDRIRARAIDAQDMPYGGGIPGSERERFAAWLDCGLPGEELAWPATTPADRPDLATDRSAMVLDDAGDLLLVVTWGGVDREVLRFRLAGDQAFWVSEAYADADGAPTWSRTWDPPLRVWGEPGEWTESVTASREEDGVASEAAETWTFRLGTPETVDARVRDQDASELVAASSSGEVYTWLLSAQTSFVERRRETTTEADVSLGLTVPGTFTMEGFPVEADLAWAERGYTRLEAE